MKYVKHTRQVDRKLENMSKSVRLDLKKYYNRAIKALVKRNAPQWMIDSEKETLSKITLTFHNAN